MVQGRHRFDQTAKANAMLAPGLQVGRWGLPVFPSLCFPRNEGDGAPKGACPGFRQSGPMVSRASPDRRTLALMTRAPAPLGAPPRHSPRFAFYGGRTCAGPVVPRRGCPAAARVRGCEPRTQVPRPAPLRTTPRPKRPSVDGTACTYSESHPKCQHLMCFLFGAQAAFSFIMRNFFRNASTCAKFAGVFHTAKTRSAQSGTALVVL